MGDFFSKRKTPKKIKEWYGKHLGLPIDDYGASFRWIDIDHKDAAPALTAWSPFKSDTTYFNPSEKSYMFNYRVENLVQLLKVLKEEGVQVVGDMEEFPYGKLGWIMDPEGNKIELWEPKDDGF